MSEQRELYALKISQPFGDFFQATFTADDLIKCTYVNQAEMENGELSGVQRKESTPRALEISRYIDSSEAAFPNSIILSVNYDEDDMPVSEENKWRFERIENDLYKIIIPNIDLKLCSVIDGQHRLLGFRLSSNKDIMLPCSIYDSLPPSGQASIFSTINFNQQKVPKSLAYRLFGYSLDDMSRDVWPPDLLAVYFSEKFNSTEGFPFFNRLKNRVLNEKSEKDWAISSSVFIDGVISLISRNPRLDRYSINAINSISKESGRKRLLTYNDVSPLRSLYIDGNDRAIEQVLLMFFNKVESHFWTSECIDKQTVLIRAVGISALFQFLKKQLLGMHGITLEKVNELCERLVGIDPLEFTKKDEYPSTTVGKKKIYDYLMRF